MYEKNDIKKLFDLAELESKQEKLRQKAINNEAIEAEQKAKMLEYVLEHVDVTAFIAVHATDYFPEKGILKPTGHFTFNFLNNLISDNSKRIIQDLQLRYPRMTIHFTLNYAIEGVAAHGQFFRWNTKYAILIPVKDFIQRVISLTPVDTWIIGELLLPSSAEILMPEKEYASSIEKWNTLAGKAKIIPYPEKYSIKEAIEIRIRQQGYQITKGGDHNWFEAMDISEVQTFIKKSTLLSREEKERLSRLAATSGFTTWTKIFTAIQQKASKQGGKHFGTLWRDIEMFSAQVYGIIFNPTHEKDTPVKDMLADFSFQHKTIPALIGNLKIYAEEIKKEINSEKYKYKEEKETLTLLMSELIKIAKFLEEIKMKGEKNRDLTWGEFLKKEKII